MKKTTFKTIATLNVNLRNSITPPTVRHAFAFVSLVLTCFGLSPGMQAGTSLGAGNTADGAGALHSLTTGIHNTAEGYQSLFSDTTGKYNTATGSQALKNNTGDNNTADGFQALVKNTTGENNAATGWRALFQNTAGSDNTADGVQALYRNTTGNGNTANGRGALFSNTTGSGNTAAGLAALQSLTTGNNNIALGVTAGFSLTTGSNNIYIGSEFGHAAESDVIRIGGGQTNTFIAGISGSTVANGVTVIVNADGHLGTIVSSRRFKDEIKPMDKASEAILALKPVTFRYKKELDPERIPQFGLVAEQVEKVSPDLVARDAKGEVYTVRYEAVNAMLLNEFLKEHRKVEEQGAIIAKQQKQIEALTAGLEKVSAQIELSKSAPQTVLNSQ